METGPPLPCFLTDRLGCGQTAVRTSQHHLACLLRQRPGITIRAIADAENVPKSGHLEALPSREEGGVGVLPLLRWLLAAPSKHKPSKADEVFGNHSQWNTLVRAYYYSASPQAKPRLR